MFDNFEEVKKWFAADGDNTLRLNYPLDENSIVFDVGAYKGIWLKQIYDKYKCTIYAFEPVVEFNGELQATYRDHKNIIVFSFGLFGEDKEEDIHIIGKNGDGSSLYPDNNDYTKKKVQLRSISKFLKSNKIEQIDLIKINVEGAEYSILFDLIKSGFIEKIKFFQIQYHEYVPNAIEMKKEITANISKTHRLMYNYEFVWESWERLHD